MITDFTPRPGGAIARAERAQRIEAHHERKAELERAAERAARQQGLDDAVAVAALSGRSVPGIADILQAASQLADLQDAREERQRASLRDEHLEERLATLRSQREALRAAEDARLAVDRARTEAERRVASRYARYR